jgi:gliding motility associated protien GldN
MNKIAILFSVLLFSTLNAQVDYSDYITSGEHTSYVKVAVKERPVISYPGMREADVKFSRRVIRCIDGRQKINKQLEWPRNPLNRFLYTELSLGNIIAYRNDSLQSSYTTEDFVKRGGSEMALWVQDDPDDPEFGHDSIITIPYKWEDIHKYWVMEDWIFDYKYSVFKPRIIAIAPIFAPTIAGLTVPDQPLCWIKMDEIRPMLVGLEMFNRYNDAARLNYDDFFQMRIFDSYIVYESNVFDNFINKFNEYADDGVGALLKSDEIKNDLFIFEHDLWQY